MDDRERLIALIYEGVTNEKAWKKLLTLLTNGRTPPGAGLGHLIVMDAG